MIKKIAFIGMGEAGGAIVSGWRNSYEIKAYDIKTEHPETKGILLPPA